MTPLVNIVCRHLALTISREACGAQLTRLYAPAACRGCEVGAAHARGETPTCWEDGESIEEVVPVLPVSAPPPPRSHKRKIPTFATLAESGRTARSWRAA